MTNTQFESYRGAHSTVSDGGKKNQSTQAYETLKCTASALRPAEAKWLEDLLISPAVYIQRDGKYIPVILQSGDFETVNDELNGISLTVQLRMANDIVTRRG